MIVCGSAMEPRDYSKTPALVNSSQHTMLTTHQAPSTKPQITNKLQCLSDSDAGLWCLGGERRLGFGGSIPVYGDPLQRHGYQDWGNMTFPVDFGRGGLDL
jgi:hypothetical protein